MLAINDNVRNHRQRAVPERNPGVMLSHGEFFWIILSLTSLQVSGWYNTDSARNTVDAKTNLPRTQWSEMKGSLRNSKKRHVTIVSGQAGQDAICWRFSLQWNLTWWLYRYEVLVPVLARLVQRGQLVNSIGPASRFWTASASTNKTLYFLRSPVF